jgi:thymidylate kinase
MIFSFSGIDGAGKSTQIDKLRSHFEQNGLRVEIIAFWDKVATFKSLRESAGHVIFKGDQGVGSPSAPINRLDKNVRCLPMTLCRWVLYFFDALSARAVTTRALRSNCDLVIFDRSIHDELANLDLTKPVHRMYAQFIAKLVPAPHITYVLDADPAQARARKPEYPIGFLIENRRAYLNLSKVIERITIVPALPMDEVQQLVLEQALALYQSEDDQSEPKKVDDPCTGEAIS